MNTRQLRRLRMSMYKQFLTYDMMDRITQQNVIPLTVYNIYATVLTVFFFKFKFIEINLTLCPSKLPLWTKVNLKKYIVYMFDEKKRKKVIISNIVEWCFKMLGGDTWI